MKPSLSRLAQCCVGTLIAASLALPVSAQEIISLVGLQLKYTTIKTGAPTSITEGDVPFAVDPVFFDCPGKKNSTCTVTIELETQFSNVSEGAVAGASITIDDSGDGIAPSNIIGMDSTSHSGMSNTRSYTWVAPNVPKGSYLIRSFLNVFDNSEAFASAGSFSRTLTVRVYKP
jgi:hypothetical protein